jgi:endonuclease/exonuclease/phosphatase family metal-dependent hydrolase
MAYVYYPAALLPGGRQEFGNAVLVRGEIEHDHKLVLPRPGRFGGMRRIAVAATVRVAGQRLRVYSTHLGTPKEVSGGAREAQVAAIVEDARLADVPVVVAGDCNDRNGVVAAFQAAGFDWATRGAGHTIAWLAWDHVFVRGLEVGAAFRTGAIDSHGASDHRAVWVELPLHPPLGAALLGLNTALPVATPATP